jgi:tetratricopeptide (TPR) repeat protein
MGDNPDELVRKAHSKLTPGFLGKMFSSKESRQEEATDLLTSAANIYKIRKDWKKAGETYEEIARLEVEQGGNTAYVHYQNAAHCFSFVDKVKSNQMLDAAIESCVKVGKYMQAGKTAQRIATECEENFDYPNAIDKYKKAAEYFAMESQNTKSMQQQCLLKVADLMCISNHKDMFTEAPKIYEKLGMQYLTVPLLKSSAKDMFFKNVMCYVAKKDEVTAEVNLKKYLLEDPTFDDTRDSKFLKAVIKCITEPYDVEGFRKEVQSYKTVRELDKWKLNMFALAIKNIEKDDMEEIL